MCTLHAVRTDESQSQVWLTEIEVEDEREATAGKDKGAKKSPKLWRKREDQRGVIYDIHGIYNASMDESRLDKHGRHNRSVVG